MPSAASVTSSVLRQSRTTFPCDCFFYDAPCSCSRSKVDLCFVAAIGDLQVELEGFEEYARRYNFAVIYVVPQSPAGDMLLKLEIITLEDAPDGWKLIQFHRHKKPSTSAGGGGFGNGGGGGGFVSDDWAPGLDNDFRRGDVNDEWA